MAERGRPKKGTGGLGRSRIQAAAEAAAKAVGALGAGGERAKAGKRGAVSPQAQIRALKRALADADQRLRESEVRSARAVARARGRAEREHDALEAQLTKLVQEIGAAKHIVARAQVLERDLQAAQARVAELLESERTWTSERAALEAEVARLREAERAAAEAALALSAPEPRPRRLAAAAGSGRRRDG